jgi:hypothetical protein
MAFWLFDFFNPNSSLIFSIVSVLPSNLRTMKTVLVIICLVTCFRSGYGQSVEVPQSISDSTKTEVFDQLGYDPVKVGDNTAEIASGWTQEEKDWFKSTFIHKRGQFRVPKQPIVNPYAKR